VVPRKGFEPIRPCGH